jgi:hypothetical protein
MSRRRRKHTTHHRRRVRGRNVGAFGLKGKDSALKLAALAGGFLLGKAINTQVDKIIAKMSPATGTTASTTNITGSNIPAVAATVGEVGLGGLLLLRKKSGGMSTYLKVAGGILAGAGLRRALGSMGIMNGYQSVPVIGRHRMAGYQSVPVIGRNTIPAQLAGGSMPAQLQGFRVNGYTPTGSGVMGKIGAVDGGSGIMNTGGGGYMG